MKRRAEEYERVQKERDDQFWEKFYQAEQERYKRRHEMPPRPSVKLAFDRCYYLRLILLINNKIYSIDKREGIILDLIPELFEIFHILINIFQLAQWTVASIFTLFKCCSDCLYHWILHSFTAQHHRRQVNLFIL